jgi:hypothetical protein
MQVILNIVQTESKTEESPAEFVYTSQPYSYVRAVACLSR